MEGTYEILMGNESVGEAEVTHRGLYLQISCRCHLSGEVLCKVMVTCGETRKNLGTLVPEGGGFCLSTKIPAKYFSGTPSFCAVPRRGESEGKFVPIYPEEPFSYLEKLKECYLERRGEQLGVRLP